MGGAPEPSLPLASVSSSPASVREQAGDTLPLFFIPSHSGGNHVAGGVRGKKSEKTRPLSTNGRKSRENLMWINRKAAA